MTNTVFMKFKVRHDVCESVNGLHSNLLLKHFLFHDKDKEVIFLEKFELIEMLKNHQKIKLILSHSDFFFDLSIEYINQEFALRFTPTNFNYSVDLMLSHALTLAINFEIKEFYIGSFKQFNNKIFFYDNSMRTICLKLNYLDLKNTLTKIVSNALIQECNFFEYQNGVWYGDFHLLSAQQILKKIENQTIDKLYVKCGSTYFFIHVFLNKESNELMLQISNVFFPWKQECIYSGSNVVFDYWRYIELLASICQGLDIFEVSLDSNNTKNRLL